MSPDEVAAHAERLDARTRAKRMRVGTGMTGPPGPVIPCTTFRAWSPAVSGSWQPARCLPASAGDGRRARKAVNRSRRSTPALSEHVGRRYRPGDGRRADARPPPDLRRLAPHRHVHAAVGRREQRVLRQVHVRVRSRRCSGTSPSALRAARPRRDRRAGRPRARRHPARDDDVAGHAACPPASCARRRRPTAPAGSPRAASSTGSGCASSKTSSPRAARSSTPPSSSAAAARVLGPVVCVIDRESGGVEKLAAEGLELHPLFTMTELKSAAE